MQHKNKHIIKHAQQIKTNVSHNKSATKFIQIKDNNVYGSSYY